MGKAKRSVALLLVAAFVVGIMPLSMPEAAAQRAGVEIYDPWGELPRPTGIEKAFTKLGRGLSNVMLGWAEIPVTFDERLKQGRPLGHLLGVAPVVGSVRAVMRTGTGVFEMVTFPFSDRDVNYEAVLEPEYIF